jgi:hypothetical protein
MFVIEKYCLRRMIVACIILSSFIYLANANDVLRKVWSLLYCRVTNCICKLSHVRNFAENFIFIGPR